MQKKIFSLVMFFGGSAVCADQNIDPVSHMHEKCTAESFKQPLGSFADVVSDITQEELAKKIGELETHFEQLKRLLREKNLADFALENREAFEAALVNEFSAQGQAIEDQFKSTQVVIEKEEALSVQKKWDGAYGYIFSAYPTTKSDAGRDLASQAELRRHKEEINKKNYELVNRNKQAIIDVLKKELEQNSYIIAAQYLKALQMCSSECDQDQDCFARCLSRKRVNWHDVQAEDFFRGFSLEAYSNAVKAAEQKGITVSLEDMEKVAQKNPTTMALAARLEKSQAEASALVAKILNPSLDNNSQQNTEHSAKKEDSSTENNDSE